MNTSDKNQTLHFVVGLGRSGTTLVSNTMNQYTEIASTPESLFLLHYIHRFGNRKRISKAEMKDFRHGIFHLRSGKFVHLDTWHVHKKELHHAMEDLKEDAGYLQMALKVYTCSLVGRMKPNARIYVDKNPPYTRHIPRLKRLSPSSRFICMVRDPRDTSVSRGVYGMDPINHPIYHGLVWRYFAKKIKTSKNLYAHDVMVKRYEDVVADFDIQMDEMAVFFGADTTRKNTTQLMEIRQKNKHALTDQLSETEMAIFNKMHSRVYQSVDVSQIGKWKHHMSRSEAAMIARVCNKEAAHFGYHFTTEETQVNLSYYVWYPFLWFIHRGEVAIHNIYYRTPLWLRNLARRGRNLFSKKQKATHS